MPDPQPDPAEAARPGCRGTPVEIGGRTWKLADYLPTLAPGTAFDRLADDNWLAGRYEADDLIEAAVYLLLANYDITPDEAVGLARSAEPASLVPAVEAALFGPPRQHRRYSDWLILAMVSNGINPRDVPPEMWLTLAEYLVESGSALPIGRWVSAAAYAARRARSGD